MKDFSVNDVFTSVKCQFARRCMHSETILGKLADDFIARYSTKQHTHPEFFKQDAALTHNQLTMYADQCVQVMRNFQFLHRGADIVQALSTSILRLLDFFTKHLYHHLRDQPRVVRPPLEDSLCLSCRRLKENEKMRALREELSMASQFSEDRGMREIVVRRGEKYDQEQLLNESLENLEVLNEDQIRKRLGKMETDHDKRKRQILVAVQQLSRANDRVNTYSRALERSGKEFSGKFNVKDYVFQIGRHFFHNISSLEVKIRLLKQSLSPIDHQEVQTEDPVILEAKHREIKEALVAEGERIKYTLQQALKTLTVEQNKNQQLRQLKELLQLKLQENDMKREEEKIQEKINFSKINNQLTEAQAKISLLETLLRKVKSAKSRTIISEPLSFNEKSTQTQKQEPPPKEKPSEEIEQFINRYNVSHPNKASTRASYLVNPKILIKLSEIKSVPGTRSVTQEFTETLFDMIPSAHSMIIRICEENRSKLSIATVMKEFYMPPPKAYSSKTMSRRISTNRHSELYEAFSGSEVQSRLDINQREWNNVLDPIHHMSKKKLSKVDLNKHESHIRTLKHRESIYIQENPLQILKKKSTQHAIALQDLRNTIDQKPKKLPTKKMLGNLKTSHGLQTLKSVHERQGLKVEFADRVVFQKQKTHKKTRHLSQQNSYEHEDYSEIKKSIKKIDLKEKEKPFLGEKEKNLLLNFNDSDSKMSLKSALHRREESRIILSLEQINYSTYFYSLLASIHLKNSILYENVKKFMVGLIPGVYDDDNGIKESLNCILLAHRKCSSGSICHHLESFLQSVKKI